MSEHSKSAHTKIKKPHAKLKSPTLLKSFSKHLGDIISTNITQRRFEEMPAHAKSFIYMIIANV